MTSLIERWMNDDDPVGVDYSVRVSLPKKYKIVKAKAEDIEREMWNKYWDSDAGKAELMRKQALGKKTA